jgi:CheY-like chemotaxis protein
LNRRGLMQLLRHSEEVVLQVVEFAKRHGPTLADAKVKWLYGIFCRLGSSPELTQSHLKHPDPRPHYGHFPLDGCTFDVRLFRAMMLQPIQVLIADDSEVIGRAIRLLLQAESIFIVGELSSFIEQVDAVKSMKPDVVLMDLHTPGEEKAFSVKENAHRTCLIAMSLFDDAEASSLLRLLGAHGILNKSTLATTPSCRPPATIQTTPDTFGMLTRLISEDCIDGMEREEYVLEA